jgi:hypothetical protein
MWATGKSCVITHCHENRQRKANDRQQTPNGQMPTQFSQGQDGVTF